MKIKPQKRFLRLKNQLFKTSDTDSFFLTSRVFFYSIQNPNKSFRTINPKEGLNSIKKLEEN